MSIEFARPIEALSQRGPDGVLMSDPPLFSIIVPTFNRDETISLTLDSVRSQEFRDFETIVVDDGSTDRTIEILQQFDWVLLLQQKNLGPGSARNLGANVARGTYLVFLDSDDVLFPWSLKTIAATINMYNRPSALAAAMVEFSEDSVLDRIEQRPLKAVRTDDFLSTQPWNDCFVGAGMTIVNSELFKELNGFSAVVRNCEDHDFMLRAGVASGFVRILAPTTLAWRRHPGNTTRVLDRTLEGLRHLVSSENANCYPGGMKRELQRKAFISARVRPVVLECTRQGNLRDALRLYMSIFSWHVKLNRWRFILGYFFVLAGATFQRRIGSGT